MRSLLKTAILTGLPVLLLASWSTDPLENTGFSDLPGDQVTPKIALLPSGEAYISWFSSESGNYNVRLQRVDVFGNELWAHNGLLVSDHTSMSWLTDYDLKADQEGCAVIAFQDVRTGNTNIYAYRISPEGEFLWGDDGIALSNNADFEPSPKIAITDSGYTIVAWQRIPEAGNDVIVLQKISPEGDLLWGDGIVLQSESGEDYTRPNLIPSRGDCVILFWFKESGVPWNPIKHLYAQKFDSEGNPVWPEDVPLYLGDDIPIYVEPDLVEDGEGGAYVGWYCGMSTLDIRVQHVDSEGNLTMAENGVPVSTMSNRNRVAPSLAYLPSENSLFVFWVEENYNQSAYGVYGQRLTPDGSRLWSDTGRSYIDLSPYGIAGLSAWPDDEGIGMFFAYYDFGNAVDSRIVGMRIDPDGIPLWDPPLVDLSALESEKSYLAVSPCSNGQWITVWSDYRNGNADIYGQNVQLSGQLGPIPSAAEELSADWKSAKLSLRPTLVSVSRGDPLEIAVELPEDGILELSLYDVTGRKVLQVSSGHFGAGRHLFSLEPQRFGLLHGVYILRADVAGKTIGSARIVLTE